MMQGIRAGLPFKFANHNRNPNANPFGGKVKNAFKKSQPCV